MERHWLAEKCLFAEKGHGLEAAIAKFPGKQSNALQGAHLCVEAATGAKFQTCSLLKASVFQVFVKQPEKVLRPFCGPDPVYFQGIGAECGAPPQGPAGP